MIIPPLDIRTLSLSTVLFALMYSVGLYLFAVSQSRFRGFYILGSSTFCLAIGFLFIGYRSFIPDFLSIVGANTLIIAAFVLAYEGITRFLDTRRSFIPVSYLLLLITPVAFVYFTYFNPLLATRIILVNALIIVLTVFCVRALIEKIRPAMRIPIGMTVLVFVLNGVFSLFRIVWTVIDDPGDRFMSAGMVHSLAFIVMDIFILGSAFGYVWIDTKLLELDLRRQARIDPLTGTLNRRALEAEIETEMARVSRGGPPFSMIMLDLDHFKRLNDTYGHKAGDITLIRIADFVRSTLRQQDMIARFGGEEFILILPETPKATALEVGERLRAGIEAMRIPTSGNRIVQITSSFGVSTFGEDSDEWQNLVELTDQALYRAKQSGRNRVMPAQSVG